SIIAIIRLCKMARETTIEGIIDCRSRRKKELTRLLNWPKGFPTNKTYTDTLAQCDYHEIAKAIAQVIVKARTVKQCNDKSTQLMEQQMDGEKKLIHTAVDGKAMRGTRKHKSVNQPYVHLLSFYECEAGMVLDHFSVEKKKN